MVRFIIKDKAKTKIDYDLIYIPIWLDLLLGIIEKFATKWDKFTFQYG